MTYRFRIGITSDFLDAEGKIGVGDIGLGLLDAQPHIAYEFFTPHQPEVTPEQIRDYDGIIALSPRITRASLAGSPRLAVIGRYILQPEVFHHLGLQEPGAGGEIQLTDALARMIGNGPFHGLRFDGTRFDCGDKAGFIEANVSFAVAHPVIGQTVRATVAELLRKLSL